LTVVSVKCLIKGKTVSSEMSTGPMKSLMMKSAWGNGVRNGAGAQRGRVANSFGGNGQGNKAINQANRPSLSGECLMP